MERREMVQLVVTVLSFVRWELKRIASTMMILTRRAIRITIEKSKQINLWPLIRSILTDKITDSLVEEEGTTSEKKVTRDTPREIKSTKKNLNSQHHHHRNSNHCNIHPHRKLVLHQWLIITPRMVFIFSKISFVAPKQKNWNLWSHYANSQKKNQRKNVE